MGDRLYFQQIADDLAVLYELSLSIGQSLDLRDNCARFLTALMARRNLSYAAVWLRSGLLGEPSSEPDGFELFWGRPHAHIQERLLPEDHQIAQRLREVPRFSCSSEDPLFDGYVTERQVESGTFAVFALGELGFLKLLALRRPEALLDSELRFLSGIVNKSAVSLEGCVAHTRLVRQMDQRRRAEAALQESEAQLRAILDHTPACIFVKGLDGRYIMVNRRFEELFQDRSFVGKTDAELFPAPVARALRANDARVMETGRAAEFEETITGDEMSRHYLTAKFPIRDDKGAPYGVCGVAFEITDRKRAEDERRQLERQMQQAQKLESLGILAGGIAHDFNNLLTGILGNANLALSAVDADSAAYRNLTQIETAALRAAELTNQMLAYSGKGRLITETIDLSEVASEMTTLLLSAIPKKTTIRSNLTPEEAIIDGDPGQIRQVVMNLITNASDAIGRRIGQITLTTRITSLEQEKLEHIHPDEALDDIPYVMLEVRDNGKGMGEDTTARIFDPFFTTKFTGRGLGLAAVLGIVRSHRGAITFESQPGSGTVFRVLFPQSRERIDDAPAADVRETSWSGEGTVLVVDDDPAAREVMELTVQRMGCETLSATNGKEGVDIYRQRWQEISLILLDLTMPVMGGEEAIEEMRRIDPDAKIILVSGYSEQDAIENFADRALSGFVQKPFLPATLVHMIRKVL